MSASLIVEHEGYCDVCRMAQGVGFFDTFWLCDECRRALEVRLMAEPHVKVTPA